MFVTKNKVNGSCVVISRAALRDNISLFRKLCPQSKFMGVIKSNAYGHGLSETVKLIGDAVDYYGVNSIQEAVRVCNLDRDTPVLVMGRNGDDEYSDLKGLSSRVAVVVSTVDDIRLLNERAPDISFHLKIDTGMGRLGSRNGQLDKLIEYLSENERLPWRGIMSHFANVEDVTDQDYAQFQLENFKRASNSFLQYCPGRSFLKHIAASSSALILPESRLDLVRIGIGMYGLWPSEKTRLSVNAGEGVELQLKPALSWVCSVVHINHLSPGEYVGYGCSYRTTRKTTVAVLPVGYYEGYSRVLSNSSFVLINGHRAPLLGRVCMNMMMVDVTDIPGVTVGSEVILIGRSGSEIISADELAQEAGTINYEIVTSINERLPRVVVD